MHDFNLTSFNSRVINRLSRLVGFKDDPSAASVGTSTCLKLMRKLFIEYGIYEEEPTIMTLL
jgi:hypothetical protein